MKIKPTSKAGGVVMELSSEEPQLPVVSPAERAAPLAKFKLRKILVPIDFSDCCRKALQYALPFARQFDAEITLLHVVKPYPQYPEMVTIDAETLREAQESIEKLKLELCAGAPVQTLVRKGDPDRLIAEAAEEQESDLIILSTHGRTGLAHVFMGSIAEQVVRRAPCPVLVVREKEHDFVEPEKPEQLS